jgi:hypothetical protein
LGSASPAGWPSITFVSETIAAISAYALPVCCPLRRNKLTSTQFEEFCLDLLEVSGFVNLDWRKGTGMDSSPADNGRDIMCEFLRSDPDGGHHFEKYFIDCKHYTNGVPPTELQNLLSWVTAERPDVAVFAVSNFLGNPAKEFVETYKRQNHPPFKIKYWEKP